MEVFDSNTLVFTRTLSSVRPRTRVQEIYWIYQNSHFVIALFNIKKKKYSCLGNIESHNRSSSPWRFYLFCLKKKAHTHTKICAIKCPNHLPTAAGRHFTEFFVQIIAIKVTKQQGFIVFTSFFACTSCVRKFPSELINNFFLFHYCAPA